MGSQQQYTDLYRQSRETICAHSAAVMNAVREQAFAHLQQAGFPTRRVERYKYTDVDALFAPDYGLNLSRLAIPVNPQDAFRCDVPNLSTSLYFVINDMFYRDHTPAAALPEGVVVASLREMAERRPELVARYYGRLARTEGDGVVALNTMLAQDGLLVYVPRGVRVERPIQVINMMRADVDLMANRRVLIIVEPGAGARLLFCDHTADDRRFLSTQVVEAYVGEGAALELYCMEETHSRNTRVSHVFVEQQRDSRMEHHVITLQSGITVNRLDLSLVGEGAECRCNGCVIAGGRQRVDNNTLIDHRACHCTSRELYKYVLDDEAVGAFAGRVLVRHGAQHTVSEETNQNLCATPQTRMYTQPMLEIYADDVKCSHGSTVGQLNDAALFYMRQRGISLDEARLLLQQAFVGEVIDGISLAPLRDRLHYLVEKRFRGELNKCVGCTLCREEGRGKREEELHQ